MTAAERIAKDFRGIASRDFPVSVRIGSKTYKPGTFTFNPGSITYVPVPGALLEDYGGPVLMAPTVDLPAMGAFEYVSVEYPPASRKWTRYEVLDRYPGQAVTTLTLMVNAKP